MTNLSRIALACILSMTSLCLPALAHRLTPLEVAEDPSSIASPILAALDHLRETLAADPAAAAISPHLRDAHTDFVNATRQIADGKVCEGNDDFSRGLTRLGGAAGLARRVLHASHPALASLEKVSRESAAAGAVFTSVCKSIVTYRTTGRITRIDDAARRIQIDSRLTVGLADSFLTKEQIYVGRSVHVIGPHFGRGTAMARELAVAQLEQGPPGGRLVDCLQLRVTPFQRNAEPFIKHRLAGYQDGNLFRLNRAMGIAAEDVNCAKPQFPVSTRYSLHAKLVYSAAGSNSTPDREVNRTLALDLDSEDPPVLLPLDIVPGTVATLTVASREQTVKMLPGQVRVFAPIKVLAIRTYKLQIGGEAGTLRSQLQR